MGCLKIDFTKPYLQDYEPIIKSLNKNLTSSNSIKNTQRTYYYGFNTQEKDDEVYGEGNLMSALFWEMDTRIGRRWNNDPVVKPWESPYLVNGGNPIWYSDPLGDDWTTDVGNFMGGLVEKHLAPSFNKLDKFMLSLGQEKQKPVLKKMDAVSIQKSVDLSANVTFTSQFTLSNPQVACCRASQKILKDNGVNGGSKSDRIITGRDNSSGTAIENTSQAKTGLDYINNQLNNSTPVMVGLNHTTGKGQSDGEAADHFVVITGRNYDEEKKQSYFSFYEVGSGNETKGKSDKNRLYVNSDNSITGTNYAGKRNFTVTDVRKNKENKK